MRPVEWNAVPYETAILDLHFASDQGLRSYLQTLTGLLARQAECRRTIDSAGRTSTGRSLAQLIANDQRYVIDYRLKLPQREDRLNLKADQRHLRVRTSLLANCQSTDLLWLQSITANPEGFPLVALPVNREGLTLDTLHPLVVLAHHTGQLIRAGCDIAEGQISGDWTTAQRGPDSLPIRASRQERVWVIDRTLPASSIWFTPSPPIAAPEITDQWWQQLLDLRQHWPNSHTRIRAHLARLLPAFPSIDHWELEEIRPGRSAAEAPDSAVVAVIQPEDQRLRVAIDPQLEGEQWGRVLLHSLAHLALGHLRPGDSTTHSDSLKSIIEPSRHRDRRASQLVSYWAKPGWWAPASLDDCTPEQKVKLGMWRILDARLGEAQLHEKARSYQSTAYQRQAATRLIDILDRYHGAILCDGVGLGKSYVAATVIVHYINTWLDKIGNVSDKRITIIAPNQVTSTWLNEVLPSIADWGARNVHIRIISHHTFSRPNLLVNQHHTGVTDFAHLILSDLVIIDEAHAFRNSTAQGSKLLGNMLRSRLSGNDPRRTLLLSAAPINNSLNDLFMLLKLLFAPHRELQDKAELNNVVANLVRGIRIDGMFDKLPSNFREVFGGIGISSLKRYLKKESDRLNAFVDALNRAIPESDRPAHLSLQEVFNRKNRIADLLLDQIVVQRSRSMCEEIEKNQGNIPNFRFRKPREGASRIKYAESSNTYKDILSNLLPLFDSDTKTDQSVAMCINKWKNVKEGVQASNANKLQRTQLLKRLESSCGSLLISYVRLVRTHLEKLSHLKLSAENQGLLDDADQLEKEVQAAFSRLGTDYEAKVRRLTGNPAVNITPLNPLQFNRLWTELKEPILNDFRHLLGKMPVLMNSILGDLDMARWPTIGNNTEWPRDPQWGRQIIRDEKVLALTKYLLNARRKTQKIIVFSEFTDTIEYIRSIFQSITLFSPSDWSEVLANRSMNRYSREEILEMIATTDDLTGNTPTNDQDKIVCRFAPYYRIGPILTDELLKTSWESKWNDAISNPVNVLFATDILAEGVNLQDAAVLINFDMHWNPVRLLQRSGRIDRRLNNKIEDNTHYPELVNLARALQKPLPAYYWHHRQDEAPQILNMHLPDELESKLKLVHRLWLKSVLISLVLGFDAQSIISSDQQQIFDPSGIVGINAIAGDRTIEQLLHYRDLLKNELKSDNVDFKWAQNLGGCFSSVNGEPAHAWIANVVFKTAPDSSTQYSWSSYNLENEVTDDLDLNNRYVQALQSIVRMGVKVNGNGRMHIVEHDLRSRLWEVAGKLVDPATARPGLGSYFLFQYPINDSGQIVPQSTGVDERRTV